MHAFTSYIISFIYILHLLLYKGFWQKKSHRKNLEDYIQSIFDDIPFYFSLKCVFLAPKLIIIIVEP